jgi:flagellar basal body-associated protein FliL
MGRSLVVAFLAALGLLCAAGMGYAAYFVSRGSVAVPVTKLQQTPARQLTPTHLRAKVRVRTHSQPLETTTTARPPTTTVDDHGGRSRGGSGGSGRGGGGHGGDD